MRELRAELRDRGGERRPLRVPCECQPPSGELRGLLGGLALLRERVSALLDPLVEQERGPGDAPGKPGDEEDEGEEDEDEEEENHTSDGPALKRTKMHS